MLQGDILCPKLFNEFLSDLSSCLNATDDIDIDSTQFTHLLYADDIVLISETAEVLQNNIDLLHKFCAQWHLVVNITKTKTMQIGTKNKKHFTHNNQHIENIDVFKYLGDTICTQIGIFIKKCQTTLQHKPKKHFEHCMVT